MSTHVAFMDRDMAVTLARQVAEDEREDLELAVLSHQIISARKKLTAAQEELDGRTE